MNGTDPIVVFILLGFLVVSAISVSLIKKLFSAVIVLASYSVVMSVVWLFLNAPDLAITEAAVGAGISSLLFYVALKRIGALEAESEDEKRVKGDV